MGLYYMSIRIWVKGLVAVIRCSITIYTLSLKINLQNSLSAITPLSLSIKCNCTLSIRSAITPLSPTVFLHLFALSSSSAKTQLFFLFFFPLFIFPFSSKNPSQLLPAAQQKSPLLPLPANIYYFYIHQLERQKPRSELMLFFTG